MTEIRSSCRQFDQIWNSKFTFYNAPQPFFLKGALHPIGLNNEEIGSFARTLSELVLIPMSNDNRQAPCQSEAQLTTKVSRELHTVHHQGGLLPGLFNGAPATPYGPAH